MGRLGRTCKTAIGGSCPGKLKFAFPTLFLLILAESCQTPSGPPFAPENALETFQIEEGFRIELVASEPLISDPVAMDIDEQGRIFIVEMPGYPLDTGPTGRVKLLEDLDGDGYPEESTVFADGLVLPTGVMCWKQGILVTAAPDVWYFEDTDGDKQADVRRVILTGFAFSNPQHTVSDPLYGLDNWVYLSNEPPTTAVVFADEFGDKGGELRFPDRPDLTFFENPGRNIRFRPDTHQLEALSGSSQFGHTFDPWGRHFTLHNSNHARHEVMAARYLERNPELLISSAMHSMSDHGNAAQVFPITHRTEHPTRQDIGQITSACSLTLYLGGTFPEGFERVSFVAEPAHNLVHRDVWDDAGATFVARRAHEGTEFLASSDSWSRPVFLYNGPDGSLFMLDYYREIIEHPEWLSEEIRESEDLYRGHGMGRLYRIVPDWMSSPPLLGKIRLDQANPQELVQQLASPNIWWRRTAQRLLVQRQHPESPELLSQLFHTSLSPVARLHALWTLEGLGLLDSELIARALADPEPGVRENAIRLAETRLSDSRDLTNRLYRMGDDSDSKVKFQLLCTLGNLRSPRARNIRRKLLFEGVEDPWMQAAALSASSGEAFGLFKTALARLRHLEGEPYGDFFRRISSVIGARQRVAEVQNLVQTAARLDAASRSQRSAAILEGLARGLQAQTKGQRTEIPVTWLLDLSNSRFSDVRRAALQALSALQVSGRPVVASTIQQAIATVQNRDADPARRADAVQLLTLLDPELDQDLMRNLVTPQEPEGVQVAAIQALGASEGDKIAPFLLEHWKSLTSKSRSAATEVLLADSNRAGLLLEAIERQEIQSWMLEPGHKQRLIMHRDDAIRALARRLLETSLEQYEKKLQQYGKALDLRGDPIRGRQIFEEVCSRCHRIGSDKSPFGPDLGTVKNRTTEELLSDILEPSKSIAQNYELYVIQLESGPMLEGIISEQTPTTVTLVRNDEQKQVLRRAEIRSIYAAQLSAMPEDLDREISVQEMSDLLVFMKTGQ